MKKKIIDNVGNGWVTAAPEEGGQIELVQSDRVVEDKPGLGFDSGLPDDDEIAEGRLPSLSDIPDDDEDDEDWEDEEDEEFDDDDEDEPHGFTNRPVSSSYHRYGSPYKNTCIICGTEFESPRPARFCVDKPACRQRYNRQERAVKGAAATADAAIGELLRLLDDQNFGKLARQLLINLEAATLKRLDDRLPDRHPKKEITAMPVRVSAESLKSGDRAFVVTGSKVRAVKVLNVECDDETDAAEWIECEQIDRSYRRLLIAASETWLKVV